MDFSTFGLLIQISHIITSYSNEKSTIQHITLGLKKNKQKKLSAPGNHHASKLSAPGNHHASTPQL